MTLKSNYAGCCWKSAVEIKRAKAEAFLKMNPTATTGTLEIKFPSKIKSMDGQHMRKERDKVDQGQIIFFFFLSVGKKICHRERRGGSKYRAGLLKFPIDVFSLSFLFFNELEALPLGGCLVGGRIFYTGCGHVCRFF